VIEVVENIGKKAIEVVENIGKKWSKSSKISAKKLLKNQNPKWIMTIWAAIQKSPLAGILFRSEETSSGSSIPIIIHNWQR
jgi:hypothetical protein